MGRRVAPFSASELRLREITRNAARFAVYGSAAAPPPERRFAGLAPNFAIQVDRLLRDLQDRGTQVWMFEGRRTPERQAWLYASGRTRPGAIVTNARSHLYSWHGYGLAVDFAFKTAPGAWYWPSDPARWLEVTHWAATYGLATGADWKIRDYPHLQPENLRVSPSATARQLYAVGGVEAVWKEVGAERTYFLDQVA